jgi:catechol-2,3-dioxygenase
VSTNPGPATPLNGLAEVTLQGPKPTELARFYQRAFGCEILAEKDRRIWLAIGPRSRLGQWTPGKRGFGDQGGTRVHFAFRLAPGALDGLAATLQAKGIAMRGPIQHDGGDRSIYVEDPRGNVVEAWSCFEPEEGCREGVGALAG